MRIEAERDLSVRGDLGHHGHDPFGVAAPVGQFVGDAVPAGVVLRAAGDHRHEARKQQREESGFHDLSFVCFVY